MDVGSQIAVAITLLVVIGALTPFIRLAWNLLKLAWAILLLLGSLLLAAARLAGRALCALCGLAARPLRAAGERVARERARRIRERDEAMGIYIYGPEPGSALYKEFRDHALKSRAEAGLRQGTTSEL